MTVSDAAALLTTRPGNLAYHLILAMSLALLFAAAQLRLATKPDDEIARGWRLAGGGLLTLRLFVMAAVGLTWLISLDEMILLPPLDRFSSFAGLSLLLWASFQADLGVRFDRLLAIVLALGFLGSLATSFLIAAVPSALAFNQTVGDLAWTLFGLGLCLGGIVLFAVRRPRDWELTLTAFVLLSGGYVFHLTMASVESSLAGFVRLSELAAYPMLAILAVREFMRGPQPEQAVEAAQPAQPEPAIPPRGPDTIVGLTRLTAADETDELAKSAVQAIGRALRAEYCLILSPPITDHEFAIATGYDLIREHHLAGASLDQKSFPVITQALKRRKPLNLPSQSRSPDLQALRRILNLNSTASALMAPMAHKDELFGGLLLLSPYARRSWTNFDLRALEQIAQHLGKRFSDLSQSKSDGGDEEGAKFEALAEAQRRVEELEADNVRLSDALQEQEEILDESHAENLASLFAMNEEAQRTIESLEAEIERLQQLAEAADEASKLPEREEQAQRTIKSLEAEIERLQQLAEAAEVAPDFLPEREDEIDRLAGELQTTLRELADTRTQLELMESRLPESDGKALLQPPDLEAIASIAQELRQPMSSILGYTDLLLGESVGLLGAMQRKFLERVRSGIERMGTLLGDLIRVTALETGTLSLTPSPVDLLVCIEEAFMQTSASLRERNLALRMDFPDEIPPVLGDDDAVIQILVHLIENAIGASPEGGEIVASARAQATDDGRFAVLSVSDSGEGIAAEDLGRVFQRMYRADNVLIQGVGDHGVGLSLVKALSEAIGGRVWVESEVGAGSTFTVLLPFFEADAEEVEPVPEPQ